MSTIKELAEELRFNDEIAELVNVMKNIAVFHFYALQEKKDRSDKTSGEIDGFFSMLDLKGISHPYLKPRAEGTCVIVVTSDEGFMGGLNIRVADAALEAAGMENPVFTVIGAKGELYMRERKKTFTRFSLKDIEGSGGKESDAEKREKLACRLKDHIVKGFGNGEFGKAVIFYPRPVSFMVQKVEGVSLLPLERGGASEFQSSVKREDGYARFWGGDIITESPPDGIMEYLVEKMLIERIRGILVESKLSEFAARAIHLEKSKQKLEESQKTARSRYFRVYRGVVDTNIREVFSSQLIIKK
ncbi:MAG: FoF1 ATP synthase subunit gamma [Candidatus Omnitrophota bacterium]